MPTGSKGEKSKAHPTFPITEWVSCELTDDEKANLKGREVSDAECMEALADIIGQGFKLSVSYDSRSDCVGVYLTSPEKGPGGVTVCLSARAPLLGQALSVLFYKHYTKLGGDWGTAGKEGRVKDQWG
jgi:hypothetical protein